MASTYSSRLRLELMASGEQSGSWGTKTNTNLGTLIEEAIAGYTTKALSDANYTLSTANGATDEARQMMLKFTGTLTANRNITVPTASKLYFVENATTGGFSLTFKTASGTGVEVLSGEKTVLYCDGTNVLDAITRRPGYNAIINGDMNIAQRGTSFAAASGYTLDRWSYASNGAGVVTITQDTSVPTVAQAGRLFTNSLKVAVTTADNSLASTDVYGLYQQVEGYNFLPLAQRTMTFSFWVCATVTGINCVRFTNVGAGRSYVAEYTINSSNTWEFKTITLTSTTAGTWNYTNGVGLQVYFALAAGSNFVTTANAWNVGNLTVTANQVNQMSSTSNVFQVTGVKLEPGSVATMSQPKIFSDELAACERYYQVSRQRYQLWAGDGNAILNNIQLRTSMRTTPSISSTTNGQSGNAGGYPQVGVTDWNIWYIILAAAASNALIYADVTANLSAEL